jgi:hypothetical protein
MRDEQETIIQTMKRSLLIVCISFLPMLIRAQTTDHEAQHIAVPIQNAALAELTFSDFPLKKRVIGASLQVKMDWGNEYTLGNNQDNPFNAGLSFRLQAFRNSSEVAIFSDTVYSLQLSNDKPEATWSLDLLPFVENVSGNMRFTFDRIVLKVKAIPTGLSPALMSKLRLALSKDVQYGWDVRDWSPVPYANIQSVVQNGKRVTFTWSDNYPLQTYHLQLLRLYNTNENTAVNEENITTRPEWRNALEMEIVSVGSTGTKSASITVGEGTGYYSFRIRPYSQYFEGGVADSRNWGAWSAHLAETVIQLPDATQAKLYFFYTDPDDHRNWAFNRVFTEENRVKETMTFGTGLQQVKQTHTYLPSQDVTLVTQTVLDYTGRPALVSIPVPLEGRESGYVENFMRAAGSELYQARHFDKDENANNPALVDQTAPGFSYYDGSDSTISSAEGYPYKRTRFYNDGTGRVKEESGIGKRHMIGNQAEGKGRTARFFYASPSDSELVSLFGDEAPNSESVIKTITVDPNNTASVSYISKEGKTIATSLSFYETGDDNLLPLDNEQAMVRQVNDTIRSSSKTANGFISTKRLNFLQPTDLHVGYSIRCEQLESLCYTSTLECDYQLVITLHTLDDNGNIASSSSLINTNLSSIGCSTVPGMPGGEKYKVVPPVISAVLPGTYLIEKKLIPGNASVRIQNNAAEMAAQINPITGLITRWLEQIENESQLERFFLSLQNLADAIYLKQLDTFTNTEFPDFPVSIDESFFSDVYNHEVDSVVLKDLYSLVIDNPSNPSLVTLTAPCCTIDVPVTWVPPFDCTVADDDGNGRIDVYEVPDFEAHAFSILSTCYGEGTDFPNLAALENVIYNTYMNGWERKGIFNLMVYHMLADRYNAENTVSGTPEVKSQYKCEDLLACWEAQITRIRDELCVRVDFNAGTPPYRVSKAYEGEQNDDPDEDKYAKDHDQHFDDNFKGGFFLTRWIAKRKVSKRMRKLQLNDENEGEIKPDPGKYHMVKDFLECSGQKFAAIITPLEAQPLTPDRSSTFTYRTDIRNTSEAAAYAPIPFKLNRTSSGTYFGTSSTFRKTDGDYYYAPLSDWNPKKDNAPGGASLFPNIKNPIYAFKYFEYSSNSDYHGLELEVCYSDPNNCYVTETIGGQTFFQIGGDGKPVYTTCCATTPAGNPACFADPSYPNLTSMVIGVDPGVEIVNGHKIKYVVSSFCGKGRVRCNYTKDAWSAGQRMTFYRMLRDYVIPQDEEWVQSASLIRDCNSLQTPYHWYTRKAGLPDENSSPEMVNEAELSAYNASDFNPLTITVGDSVKQVFSFVQMEMVQAVKDCNSECERKRSTIRRKIIAMAEARCYTIGGCRTDDPSTFNVIPEEDIDAMVESIVTVCRGQCNLTSFACGDTPCREITTPYTSVGPTSNEVSIAYGVGGIWNNPDICNGTAPTTFADLSACSTVLTADINGDGQPENIRRCATENAGIPYTLSYYEYTLMAQVTGWDFDVELPSKCQDGNGNPIPIDNMTCCTDPPVNGFKGSTFLDKSMYEVNPNLPHDATKTKVGDPIYSPAVGINVSIQPPNNQ